MDWTTRVPKRALLRTGGAMAASAPFLSAGTVFAATPRAAAVPNPPFPRDVIYVNANVSSAGGNRVIGYRRGLDGRLRELPGSPYPTGGTGFFIPDAPLGVFDGDQQVIVDRGRGLLYASNSGSDTVSAFRIQPDGALVALPGSPFATDGSTPTSLGLHEDSIVVLNANLDPAQAEGAVANVVLSAITDAAGDLVALPKAATRLPAGSGPTQVLTANTAPFTFLCNFFEGTIQSLASVAYGTDGALVSVDVQTPPQQGGATSVPKPLGLWASPNAPILYVGFPTTGQIGVYAWNEIGRLRFLRTAAVSGVAPCWLRVSPDGNRLYAIETGDNSISTLDVSDPASPFEIQNIAVTGLSGRLVQPAISADGRFLTVIQRASNTAVTAPDATLLLVFAIGRDGTLTPLPDETVALPVPPNTNPQGVVAL